MADPVKSPPAIQPRPKMPPALGANKLKRADTERGYFFAIVPNDVTLDDLRRPSFWQHHIPSLSGGQTFRPFARIEVVREDGSLDADLRVISTGPGMAQVRVLRAFVDDRDLNLGKSGEAADLALELPPGYKTVNIAIGEKKGWRVTMPNGEELASRLVTRREAVKRAMDHYAIASGGGAQAPASVPPAGSEEVTTPPAA